MSEIEEFDWFNFKSEAMPEAFVPEIISVINVTNETTYDRKMRMLRQLSKTCTACSMCELGLKGAVKDGEVRDPHVFSNMNPTRFMVYGQNPGWNELKLRTPFVGAAGDNFNEALAKYGLSRDEFYISNVVKCYTANNASPEKEYLDRCEPFVKMELNLIKPRLVITLGAPAFKIFCPGLKYSDSLGTIVDSKFGHPVFPILHPSPLNLCDKERKAAFYKQIALLCRLIKKVKENDENG